MIRIAEIPGRDHIQAGGNLISVIEKLGKTMRPIIRNFVSKNDSKIKDKAKSLASNAIKMGADMLTASKLGGGFDEAINTDETGAQSNDDSRIIETRKKKERKKKHVKQ